MMDDSNTPEGLVIDFSDDFTIMCKFNKNVVKFAFELGSINENKVIYLYSKPIFTPEIDSGMEKLLSKHAIKYLESCGYEVRIVP